MSFFTRKVPGANCPVPEHQQEPTFFGKVKLGLKDWLNPGGLAGEYVNPNLTGLRATGTFENQAATINKALQDLFKNKSLINNVYFGEINEKAIKLLFSGDLVNPEGTKAIFKGFDENLVKQFREDLKGYKVASQDVDALLNNITQARQVFTDFGNKINIKNFGNNFPKVMEILKDRTNGFGATEIKMYKDDVLKPMYNEGPLASARENLKKLLLKNTDGVPLAEGDIDIMLDNISRATLKKGNTIYNFEYKNPFSAPNENPFRKIKLTDFYDSKGRFVPQDFIKTEQQLQAFRAYLGEFRNIGGVITNVIHDMSTIVSRDATYTKILNDLNEIKLKDPNAPTILSMNPEEIRKSFPGQKVRQVDVKLPIADEYYHTPLSNKEGKGLFTTDSIANALEYDEKLPFADIVKQSWYRNYFMPLNSLISGFKTVVNPFRQILNLGQYMIMGLANGSLLKNPMLLVKEAKRAFAATALDKSYMSLLKKTGFNAADAQLIKLDSATYRLVDIMNEEGIKMSHSGVRNYEALLNDVDFKSRLAAWERGDTQSAFKGIVKGKELFAKTLNKFSGAYQVAKDTYISSDEFFKYLNTLSENDTIKNIYNKSNLAIKPTEEEMFRMACAKTRRMMPNFNMSNKLELVFRRNPIMGNFVMWPSQAARNVIAIARESYLEMTHPSGLFFNQGLKRALSLTTTLGGLTAGGAAVWNARQGITNDVESAVRRFAPKWMGLSSLGVKQDEQGNYTVTDINHINPYTIITGPLTGMVARMMTEKAEDPDAFILQGMLPGFFEGVAKELEPFYQIKLPIAGVVDAIRNTSSLGQPIYNVGDSFDEKTEKIISHVFTEAFEPAGVSEMHRLYLAATGKPGAKGENYYLDNEAWSVLGLRKIQIDPLQSFDSKVSEYLRTQSYIEGEMRNFFGSQDRPNINLTEDQIIQQYLKLNQLLYDAKSNLKLDYNAANTLGLDDSTIYNRQKNQHKLLNEVRGNNFVPLNSFLKGLQNYAQAVQQRQAQATNPEDINIPDLSSLFQKINQMNMDLRSLDFRNDVNQTVNIRDYLDNTGILGGTIASVEKLASQVNLPYKQQETNSLNSGANVNPSVIATPPNVNQDKKEERKEILDSIR
jgi:hypothetical protein